MEEIDLIKAAIKKSAVASFPKSFLVDLNGRVQRAYSETYQEVAHSGTILADQKRSFLSQKRHYRVDYELAEASASVGINHTSKSLPDNDWNFTYAVIGEFGFTQSGVTKIGSLPNAAKFRNDLANAARMPRLGLDDNLEIYESKNYYGLFAHNPISNKFVEKDQKLGSFQLCVPYPEMKGWILEIPVVELIALYEEEPVTEEYKALGPMWKKRIIKSNES